VVKKYKIQKRNGKYRILSKELLFWWMTVKEKVPPSTIFVTKEFDTLFDAEIFIDKLKQDDEKWIDV
jgi:hypothetical protein